MSRYPRKDPQFNLTVLLLIALSAFSCGGGICGLSGLFSHRDQVADVDSPRGSNVNSTSSPISSRTSQPQSLRVPTPQVEPQPQLRPIEQVAPESNPVESLPSAEISTVASSAVQLQPGDVSLQAQIPPLREWTSRDGAFRTSAKFAGFIAGKVRLNKAVKNEVVDVPLAQLSAVDQKYIADLIRVDEQAKVIFGTVISIADGDTLTVLDEGKQQHKIRLEGIDSPEGGQAFGDAAKQALSSKVFGKFPWVEWRDTDKYGRTLGHVYLDGRHVNLEMVAEGFAWHYKQYSNDPRLANAEFVARGKRLGLWSDSSPPVAPWDFRHPQPMPGTTPNGLLDRTSPQDAITVYVTRTGMSYHAAGCRFLAKSSAPISLDDARSRYKPCAVCNPPR